MNISPADLEREFLYVWTAYPIVRHTELSFGLPTYCLFAVGSRETNFDPVYLTRPGDNGHGWAWWQLDDRSHIIPPGFLSDVAAAARFAAVMLAALIAEFGEDGGYDAYNSNRAVDFDTTGHDYGPDVLQRRLYLVGRFPTTGEDDMYWGKDGADLDAQVADARTSKCREWWLMYHAQREPSVTQLTGAVAFWHANGGDLTQAGIRDGRWGT